MNHNSICNRDIEEIYIYIYIYMHIYIYIYMHASIDEKRLSMMYIRKQCQHITYHKIFKFITLNHIYYDVHTHQDKYKHKYIHLQIVLRSRV